MEKFKIKITKNITIKEKKAIVQNRYKEKI